MAWPDQSKPSRIAISNTNDHDMRKTSTEASQRQWLAKESSKKRQGLDECSIIIYVCARLCVYPLLVLWQGAWKRWIAPKTNYEFRRFINFSKFFSFIGKSMNISLLDNNVTYLSRANFYYTSKMIKDKHITMTIPSFHLWLANLDPLYLYPVKWQ